MADFVVNYCSVNGYAEVPTCTLIPFWEKVEITAKIAGETDVKITYGDHEEKTDKSDGTKYIGYKLKCGDLTGQSLFGFSYKVDDIATDNNEMLENLIAINGCWNYKNISKDFYSYEGSNYKFSITLYPVVHSFPFITGSCITNSSSFLN